MQDSNQRLEDFFGVPNDVYTRTQTIEGGVLFDVTQTAHGAGFRSLVITIFMPDEN